MAQVARQPQQQPPRKKKEHKRNLQSGRVTIVNKGVHYNDENDAKNQHARGKATEAGLDQLGQLQTQPYQYYPDEDPNKKPKKQLSIPPPPPPEGPFGGDDFDNYKGNDSTNYKDFSNQDKNFEDRFKDFQNRPSNEATERE